MVQTSVADVRPSDLNFFRTCITAMAVVAVSGFVVQLAMGRSSFASPLTVHAHALVFMGWVAIIVAQVWLAAAGSRRLHRSLGALAVFWACAVLATGVLVTIAAVRDGRVPFFFQPQHFLLADPASLIGFLALFAAAVTLRRQSDWHARLQIGAFVMLMGAGIGRMLPMPFLTPFAFETASVVPLAVPLIGMLRDRRVHGRVHPAWWWTVGVPLSLLILVRLIAFSPAGDAIYAAATAGSGAAVDGRAFPAP